VDRKGIQALLIGLVVSVLVVAIADAHDSDASFEESATFAPETPEETQPLHEQVRGVLNYGYEMGTPGGQNAVHWDALYDELDADALEYRALLDSLSPGVRASYDGLSMVRRDAFKREEARREAEQERAEAEYAVFIEEHLRRLSGEAPVSEPVPVSTPVEKRWKKIYRGVLTTPQSMIGGYAATDSAVGDFMDRARPVPPEVSKAWKTVMRLKSEGWDVEACVRYQRAQFVICEHQRAAGCQKRLERALSDCNVCSTDGVCRDGERITYGP
jgi:hypothetical protein